MFQILSSLAAGWRTDWREAGVDETSSKVVAVFRRKMSVVHTRVVMVVETGKGGGKNWQNLVMGCVWRCGGRQSQESRMSPRTRCGWWCHSPREAMLGEDQVWGKDQRMGRFETPLRLPGRDPEICNWDGSTRLGTAWLVQDVRQTCTQEPSTEDPRASQGWWRNKPQSHTQKVQKEAGGQCSDTGLASRLWLWHVFTTYMESKDSFITVRVTSFWKLYFSQGGRLGDLMPSGILWLSMVLTPESISMWVRRNQKSFW